VNPSLLLVDDDPSTRLGFSRFLMRAGYDVSEASCLEEAREAIGSRRFDAVILDLYLPDGNGLDWISELRGSCPDIAIVVITGAGDIPLAVDAMRRGADNFLAKPVNLAEVDVFLRKGLELAGLRRTTLTQRRLSKKTEPFFGQSPAMKRVRDFASLAAENDSTVLFQGESGSGKGVLARWIYEHGQRRSGPFVEINCSSLRGELLASELFGHVRGAFTSAVQDRQGLIEVADGGTLFLDEIGDMDLQVQSQFLKVIEEKSYRRFGETNLRKSDFRLVCATNKDLAEEIRSCRFRGDLYYRINLFPILIPPLRERQEDLPGHISHILHDLDLGGLRVSPDAMSLLASYDWPGNVRELRNVMERAMLLSRRAGPLEPEHFPGIVGVPAGAGSEGKIRKLAEIEADHIRELVGKAGGNARKVAEDLGISRATLYRKLKKSSRSR